MAVNGENGSLLSASQQPRPPLLGSLALDPPIPPLPSPAGGVELAGESERRGTRPAFTTPLPSFPSPPPNTHLEVYSLQTGSGWSSGEVVR